MADRSSNRAGLKRGSARPTAPGKLNNKSEGAPAIRVCAAEALEPRVFLSVSFHPQQTVAVGGAPFSVAVADLGNGHPDVVVANNGANTVSVLPGNGDGTFQPQQTVGVGLGPASVAVADLGNGHPDLVVANERDDTVGVLLGNGDGTFQPQQTVAVSFEPNSVAVADLGNGHPDLVVANEQDGTVSVLLGNGDGTFHPQQTVAVGGAPFSVAVADLGNGHPDLVVANDGDNTVSVLLGNGDGTFQPQQTMAVGVQPESVAVADLGNGHPDLVVANGSDDTVSVLLGNGDGTFQPQQTVAVGNGLRSVAVADLGNGHPDLVVANVGDNTVSVLVGNGDGTFQPQQTMAVGDAPLSVAVADLGNGQPDLVVANSVDDTVSILLNGSSTVQPTITTTSVSASNVSTAVDAPITFTATVASTTGNSPPATGSVSFFDGGAQIGSGVVAANGTATFTIATLAVGSHSITASYSGDANYAASTSAPITQTVNAAIVVPPPAKIGGVDPSFGANGLVAHDVGFTSTSGVMVQSDGKSILIGVAGDNGGQEFGITRYNADGSLDTTFGTDGVTDASLGGLDVPSAEEILPDGDILVAGTATTVTNGVPAGSQFALAEFTPAGALDTTFGGGAGFVLTSFSLTAGALSNDVANALAVGAVGEIYLAGSSDAAGHGTDFAIAAYNADGSPATSFGNGGHATLDIAGGDDSISSIALGAKGDIVAAGSSVNPSTGIGSVALAGFLPDGTLNAHFGAKGIVTTSVGGVDDAASSLAIDPKGKIVVGGYSATGSAAAGTLSSEFLVLRYTDAGKLDATFGDHGSVVTSFNQPAAISTVLIDADGTIVASGKTTASLATLDVSQLDLAVARYTAKGQLDSTFNGTGQAIISLAGAVADSLTHFDATSDLMTAFMQLTQSDQGVIAMTTGGDLLGAGNSGASTVEAAIVAEGLDLTAMLTGALPRSVIGGGKGAAIVNVGEAGTALAAGSFTVALFASSGPDVTEGQSPFQSFPEKLKLKEGTSKNLKLKFLYPSSLTDGDYYLVATVSGTARDLNLANNTSASGAAVLIAAPFVQLSGSALTAPTFNGAKPATVAFTITNGGNETASAASAVQFFASTTGTPTGATSLATTPLKLKLKPGMPHVFKEKLALPASLAAGTYMLVALLDPANVFNDPNAAANFIVSGNSFVIG